MMITIIQTNKYMYKNWCTPAHQNGWKPFSEKKNKNAINIYSYSLHGNQSIKYIFMYKKAVMWLKKMAEM